MSNISFPVNPVLNDVYLFNDKIWKFNGIGWIQTLNLDEIDPYFHSFLNTGGTINGDLTISNGIISGDGSGLNNIPASGITGLNITGDYLPLSGGTLTGDLNVMSSAPDATIGSEVVFVRNEGDTNIDEISSFLHLTKTPDSFLFNALTQYYDENEGSVRMISDDSFCDYGFVDGAMWGYVDWLDVNNVQYFEYNNNFNNLISNTTGDILGIEYTLFDTRDNKYYRIYFNSFNYSGTETSYQRWVINVKQYIKIETDDLFVNKTINSDTINTVTLSADIYKFKDYKIFLGETAGKNATNANYSNFLGNQAGYGAAGAYNSSFIGDSAGYNATNAYFSIFLGSSAGYQATSAYYSNFLGQSAGQDATNATYSNFFGRGAGQNATNATYSNFFGGGAGYSASGAYSSNFFGNRAGYNATNAYYSNFLGQNAGNRATNASGSNFLGQGAGSNAIFASFSNFFGASAGNGAINANNSNFLGQNAGFGATYANDSNFLGNSAGVSAAGAYYSNFLGDNAGYQATNAYYSNFLGRKAGYQAADAQYSNFLGYLAGYQATNAIYSNFFGYVAGYQATSATYSNFIGSRAGNGAINANNSNFLGQNAGFGATGASFSTLIGYKTGNKLSGSGIGSNNIIIGTNISLPDNTTNSLNIGGVLFGTGLYFNSGSTQNTGATENAKIGVNVVKPTETLEVSGYTKASGFKVAGTVGYLKSDGAVDTNTYSLSGHIHDDRYYTETEINNLLSYKSDTGHTHYQLYQPNGINPFVYTDNGGTLHIDGNITQSGSTYETHAEQIYTSKNYIYLRSGSTVGLSNGEYTGFEAIKYDGLNNGRLVFDNSGTARVGDVGDEQPLTTRNESSGMTNGGLVYWDSNDYKIKTSDLTINNINDRYVNVTGDTINGNLIVSGQTTGQTYFSVSSPNGTIFEITDTYILKSSGSINGVTTGVTTVYKIDKTKGISGWFKYNLKNQATGAYRAGEVTLVWDSTNDRIEFTEVSSNDLFANTSDVVLSATISGSNVNIISTVTSGTWDFKMSIEIL